MVKIRYRGTDLADPEIGHVKAEVSQIKKKFKKMKCIHHEERPSIIHLRYVKQNPVLENYVKACCYEFETFLKGRLHEELSLHQIYEGSK